MNTKEMFPNLIIDESKKEEFKKYLFLKGKNIFFHVYKILSQIDKKVKYEDLTSLIKYDKNLRDFLYKYLATFEEELRAKLFKELTYKGEESILKNNYIKLTFEKADKDILNFNTYIKFELELGPTIQLIKKYNLFSQDISKFNEIRELRNKVMHFNMLTLLNLEDIKSVKQNIDDMKKRMIALKECLPLDYQIGFTNDINKLPINNNIKEFKILI